ncbi:hypothetical protein [Actinomycetospora cinnamomea]|uniref:Uncharacterized protein n=1 Tax=Actinomycetospora cinnamomea TaxID=663609 RepID=A0A2U1FD96_9PSEU|nr:hypothetical protein [Actinomycetospora cinnamomea]PVZ09930.1 hypothetical protein C8D89_1053 [Actinomycetospora cinnamomea]
MTAPSETPRTVRRIASPAAAALADLAAIFDDLQTVLLCCERLVTQLSVPEPDPVVVESLWTTALLSYSRCFAPGGRGMGLTEADVEGLELEGEVLAWHKMVRQIKKHYADPAVNPRETFEVGVAVSDGTPQGVAITSTRQALPDTISVHQTGAIAYQLSQLVDARIGEHQATVLEGARTLSPAELETLDEVELTEGSE